MIRIDQKIIDKAPSEFLNELTSVLHAELKEANHQKDRFAMAYVQTNDTKHRMEAIFYDAKSQLCLELLQSLRQKLGETP